MAASVEQARQEQLRTAPSPVVSATANSTWVMPPAPPAALPPKPAGPQTTPRAPLAANTPGLDPMDFVRANRIQVQDGSLFVDPYLVLHPRELDPQNDAALRQKLALTYSLNDPSFYDYSARSTMAVNLGLLIPVSADSKRASLLKRVNEFNAEQDTHTDTELIKQLNDKKSPFHAIVRDTMQEPERDPVGLEILQNGLAMTLLMRQKLTSLGYLDTMTDYVRRNRTPDQVLADLGSKIGVTPLQVREAALRGGLEAVGALLGLDPAYVAEVRALSANAATQEFSYNMVEHWHRGRQALGPDAPLAQKIAAGMQARITEKSAEYRAKIRQHYAVPVPVAAEQDRIAQALELVEPVQRALMYALGYEICYTPEVLADGIAKFPGIYGLHRKAANNARDIEGTYRVYFSGHGDLKGSMRTMVHEIAHNLWPEQFSPEETTKIDALAASDKQRFADLQTVMKTRFPEFERLVNAYKAGNAAEKAAIAATAGDMFKNAQGAPLIDGVMLGYIDDPHAFRFMVQHAFETLSVEGARYNFSYGSPQERFREVISRFAELKQVEYRGQPQLLHYLAPGLDDIFEQHYLPHLERQYQAVLAARGPASVPAMPPSLPVPVPANDTRMGVVTAPKLENRPTAAADGAHACISDAPTSTVDASSVLPSGLVNDANALAAMNTIESLHRH